MNSRSMFALVENIDDVVQIPKPLMQGIVSLTHGTWRTRQSGRGLLFIGGVDVRERGDWIVVGQPSRDPRGLPGTPMSLEAMIDALDDFGEDCGSMIAGPWMACRISTGEVVRAVNHIVPWLRGDSYGLRAWATDPNMFDRRTIVVDGPVMIADRGSDPVPGFTRARLMAELDAIVTATRDARAQSAPNIADVWMPELSKHQKMMPIVAVVSAWRREAGRRWCAANAQGLGLHVPALERVVLDQLAYEHRVAP